MMRNIFLSIIIFVMITSLNGAVYGNGDQQISVMLEKSAVLINIVDDNGKNVGHGSGFLITKDGFIGTNYHVIKDAVKQGYTIIAVFEKSRKTIKAEVRNWDEKIDFAVIKVDRINGADYKPLILGDSDKVGMLAKIYTAGYPITDDLKIQTGYVNASHNRKGNDYFDISILIDHGNSGGPVIDEKGRLIGICVAYQSDARSVNLAIKINNVKKIIDDAYVVKKIAFPIQKKQTILSSDGRYTDNGDGTITDKKMGLMWAKLDSYADLGKCLDWDGSKSYVSGLLSGGYSDWRLPTIGELKGIYEQSKTNTAFSSQYGVVHIDTIFARGGAYGYWSTEEAGECCASTLLFNNGLVSQNTRDYCISKGVRAVRRGH